MVEKDNLLIEKGDIFMVDFGDTVGSEIRKIRPTVIFSNNVGNKYSETLIVLPITNREFRGQPTQVMLEESIIEGCSAKLSGLIMGEQIRTVSKKRLKSIRIGKLTEEGITKLERAVMTSIGIEMK